MGCHLVEINGVVGDAEETIIRTVYDVRGVITGPGLTAVGPNAATVGTPVLFEISLGTGDLVDVVIDYDDGTRQFVHIPKGPAKFQLEKEWSSLGNKNVRRLK